MPLPCPDRATLASILDVDASPEEVERLAAHLESCAPCGSTVEGLLAADPTVASLRGAKVAADASSMQFLRTRLASLRPAASVKQDGTVALSNPSLPHAIPLDSTEAGIAFLAPAQQHDEVGRLAHYRILKKLGAGGMGMVFLAEDVLLKRKVALKTMLPHIAVSPQARERFFREARAAAALEHANVVTIHQVGEDNGVPFLAMPFLKGESLETRLARLGKLGPYEAARIAVEMCEGLHAAHVEGLIHRDIKPGNVWLEGERGQVKVLDFGLARAAGDTTHLTQSGAIVGTPAFMAPEQARGANVDARADLFSVGCVLYSMLTGKRPFSGETIMSLLTSLALDTPPSPQLLDFNIPPALSDFTMRLLSKEPGDRPASAKEAAAELRRIVREEMRPAQSKTAVLPKPLPKAKPPVIPMSAPKRRRGMGWFVGIVLAAVAIIVPIAAVAAIVLIIRDRDGKKVAEVTVPDGGKVEIVDSASPKEPNQTELKKSPGAALTDRELPFVLQRKGNNKSEAFQHLWQVMETLRDGDAIEVFGNGPFEVGLVNLEGIGLRLKAAPGYRPRFFVSATVPHAPHTTWIQVNKAPLLIEGCDFWSSHNCFAGGGGAWEFRNCRLLNGEAFLATYDGPSLRFVDSLLWLTGGRWGEAALTIKGPLLEFENNIVYSQGALVRVDPMPADRTTIRLLRNTIWTSGSNLVQYRGEKSLKLTLEARSNVLQTTGLLTNELAEQTSWRGTDNLYVGEPTFLMYRDSLKDKETGWEGWKKRWGKDEQNGRFVEHALFTWDGVGEYANDPKGLLSYLQKQAQRAKRLPDENLGPKNWDLIGPGDAYLRALAVENRAIQPLRPDPPASGPIVLVRKRKVVSGYPDFVKASAAALDGDVIEIRTEVPLPRVELVEGEERSLWIRAAPGYRPVFGDGLYVDGKTALTVEGVHFAKGGIAPLKQGARLERLANCSFAAGTVQSRYQGESILPNLSPDLVRGDEHGNTEIVNCLIPGISHVEIAPAGRVELRNSVFGHLAIKAPQQIEGNLEVVNCLFWRPVGTSQAMTVQPNRPDAKGKIAIVAANTLFDCGFLIRDRAVASWKGYDNVYRVGPYPWLASDPYTVFNLSDWRRHWKNEGGSQEADPLSIDPLQWRLLPGSPGNKPGPDGKDLGADVTRVAR